MPVFLGAADMATNNLFKQIKNMYSSKSGPENPSPDQEDEEEDKSKKPNKIEIKKYRERDYELLELIEKLYNDKTIPITTDIMNEIFTDQGIVITEDDINLFETCEYHDIDLSISDYRKKIVSVTGGKTEVRRGVYIWTLKCKDSQYVGGSLNIYRRLNTYFETSLLRINKIMRGRIGLYGHSSFILRIYLLPEEKATINLTVAMEQYFILKLRPTMNILKVARASIGRVVSEEEKLNSRINKGKKVYIYDKTKTKLIYIFNGRNQMNLQMGVDKSTITKYINTGKVYNDRYLFYDHLLEQTREEFVELNELLGKKSKVKNPSGSIPIQAVSITNKEDIIEFKSASQAGKYFRLSLFIILRRVETKQSIKGYYLRLKTREYSSSGGIKSCWDTGNVWTIKHNNNRYLGGYFHLNRGLSTNINKTMGIRIGVHYYSTQRDRTKIKDLIKGLKIG